MQEGAKVEGGASNLSLHFWLSVSRVILLPPHLNGADDVLEYPVCSLTTTMSCSRRGRVWDSGQPRLPVQLMMDISAY